MNIEMGPSAQRKRALVIHRTTGERWFRVVLRINFANSTFGKTFPTILLSNFCNIKCCRRNTL